MNPLSGCRVLDLTGNIAGPFATMILADLGAEVIKIERLDTGDDARQMSPFFGEWSAYFLGINRNKRSLALNLKDERGMNVIWELAPTCDVVIQNFRGGKAETMGLSYEHFKRVREDVIYCSISAYGQLGPQKDNPGYDALVQAQTGLLSINGANASELARVGVSLLDMSSGMWAAMGVVTALLQRKATGKGQSVSTSLYESGIMWGMYHLLYYQAMGKNPEPQGTRHTAFAPYGAYETQDDKVFIGVSNDRLFEKFCLAIDQWEWTRDPHFQMNAARLEHRSELESMVNETMRAKPSAEWLQRFAAEGVPAVKVKLFSDVMEDPQLHSLNLLAHVEVDGFGHVQIPKLPLKMDMADASSLQPAPRLGEDTAEILGQLGYTAEQIAELIRCEVVSVL